ncbi:HAUS augmin-like complex subunit 3, partial [Galemys pyrenaicus]
GRRSPAPAAAPPPPSARAALSREASRRGGPGAAGAEAGRALRRRALSCGADFVEALRRLGYPGAGALGARDFDWLFERAEDAAFLRWFCARAGAACVLAAAELRAFGALRAAGRPVLEGAALDEALRTRAPGPAPAAPAAPAAQEAELAAQEAELAALEAELRALRGLRLRRRHQAQLLAAAAGHRARALGAREAAAAGALRRGRAAVGAAAARLGAELRGAAGAAARLSGPARAGAGPPATLAACPVERYLGREERSTAALAAYARTRFARGAREAVRAADERGPRLLPAPAGGGERREMARLRLADQCARHQLLQLRARSGSLRAAVARAEEALRGPAARAADGERVDASISLLNAEILKLEEEIASAKDSLPAVVRENAQSLSVPVVEGDVDAQLARQDRCTARQEFVLGQLIKQKASFELLQLSFEIELRKHWDVHRQLENLVQELSQSNRALQRRLEMLTDPAVSQQTSPRNAIGAKDHSARRQKKELFITRGNLEKAAQELKQAVSLEQNKLEISTREHSSFLSKLNNDVDMLCDTLYQGGKQLLLSDQDLTEQFHQVESQLNKLNHLFTDVLADVKTKRKMLASNKLLQMERKLYVYFSKDENHLKNIVENLENQSKMKSCSGNY